MLFAPLVAVLLILLPVVVRAAGREEAAVNRLVAMNKRALDDFDNLEWKSAKRRLLEAIAEGKKSGIATHPVMARTYLHLGAVFIAGFKDRDAGVQSFARALEIDPTIRIASAMETPAMTAAFADALAKQSPDSAAATADDKGESAPARKPPAVVKPAEDEEPDMPVRVVALDCPNTDEVARGKAFPIRCAVASTLKVGSVMLFYRVPGQEEFSSVEMKKTPKGWYLGEIPKDVTTGKAVQFYVEGRDRGGKPIVANGRTGSPNLMLVRDADAEEAPVATSQAVEPEENPLEAREKRGPRVVVRKTVESRPDPRFGHRRWWIGLGLGSGFGYAKGDGLEYRGDLRSKFGAGLSWAGLGHVAPELGVHLGRTLALSLEGRVQWIPQSGVGAQHYASGATAVLLRFLFFTPPGRLRLYGTTMAGFGVFRMLVYADAATPGLKDTVRGGPILVGLGGGLSYYLTKSVSFVLEVNGLAGYQAFSAVGDVNSGLQVNF